MRERLLRAGASASTVGSSSEAAAANTESRGPISGMASSGGGPQRSGLLSLGAAAAAARGRGSADSSSATPRPRFAAHATPAPEVEGTILRAVYGVSGERRLASAWGVKSNKPRTTSAKPLPKQYS